MSDFLVASFDCTSSPTIALSNENGTGHNAGWGFAWYPNDEAAASIVKDSSSKEANELASALSNWNNFRSTTFLCKIKGASKRYTHQSTQPFSRSFGGRDWLFLHNGELDKAKLAAMLKETGVGVFEPVGNTDSEFAFCVLLTRIFQSGKKVLSDIPDETIHEWFLELDALGSADFSITDGRQTASFHGSKTNSQLRVVRVLPPHKNLKFHAEGVTLAMDDPSDTYRTAVILTSCNFNGAQNWVEMRPNQTVIFRRGILKWSNFDLSIENKTYFNPKNEPTNQKPIESDLSPFSPSLTGQAMAGPKVVNIKSMIRSYDGRPLTFKHYRVCHKTKYRYEKQILRSSHVLRLQPVEDQVQEIIKSTLQISVQGEQLDFEDVFGNQSIHLTLDFPYQELEFSSESEVKIFERPPDDFSSQMRRVSIPLVWMPWQRQMMSPYLLPPELPETQLRELSDFAMSFVERNDYNLLDTLNELNTRIFKDFNYVSGSTTNETSPFEVYSSRKGVCQDFANLFICMARLLNVPARYRVGYIYTGSKYENKEQSDASHAWAEVYLPYIGWRGFDPTNGCIANQDHIRVACGRNFRDATPTSGTIFKGGGTEFLNVDVKVEEVTG